MAWQKWRPYMNWREVGKFWRYTTGSAGFDGAPVPTPLSDDLLNSAATIRGRQHPPAIFIQGMMPRSGTVYIGQLLRHHPDLHAFPRNWFELPMLQLTAEINRLEAQFLFGYRHNRGKVDPYTFLALLGGAMIAHLQAATPPGKRMLFKIPNVEYLTYFGHMFPFEHVLVLLRDGRDLVDSTKRTWPMIPFASACRRWRQAAHVVGQYDARQTDVAEGYWLARYEDAVTDPHQFVREACARFNLDVSRYPFEAIDAVRVRGSSHLTADGVIDWEPKVKPRDFNPIGYWQRWSRLRKLIFKRVAGRALVDLGYAADQAW